MTYFDSGVDVFNAFSHLIMEMLRNSNFKSTAHSKEELNSILSKHGLEAFYSSCLQYHNWKCVDARKGFAQFLHSLQCYDKDDIKDTFSFSVGLILNHYKLVYCTY